MHALTFHGRHTIAYERVADPAIRDPQDAIVKVELTALCGSDLHVYHERERGLDRGCVMGHEMVGTVVERGAGVSDIRTGERVVAPFSTSCGRCFYCARGLTARCVRGQLFGWVAGGAGLQGAQAEHVRVPLADSTLVRVPDGMDAGVALLCGDVLATGWYCADMAGVEPGGTYAVIGCGPVGLCAVLATRARGAARVYAIDAVPERLAMAARLGATPLSLSEDPAEAVRAVTEGRGADAVLEAVGSAAAGALAYALVRPGGTIAVAGVHTEPGFAFTPAQAYDKNLTLRVGRCPARGLIDRVIPLARERAGDLAPLITHRLPLSDGPAAYRMFDARADGCIKVVLAPGAE